MRDPRTAPLPGDWLAVGEALVRVDRVVFQLVLGVVFWGGSMQPSALLSLTSSEWTEATREAGVVVLPADDPRQTAMILETV